MNKEKLSFYAEHIDDLVIVGIPCAEQETVINYNRDGDEATLYTTDNTVLTNIKKLVRAGEYRVCSVTIPRDSDKNFEISSISVSFNKSLISLRKGKNTRDFTEEQKRELSNRMKKIRENRT